MALTAHHEQVRLSRSAPASVRTTSGCPVEPPFSGHDLGRVLWDTQSAPSFLTSRVAVWGSPAGTASLARRPLMPMWVSRERTYAREARRESSRRRGLCRGRWLLDTVRMRMTRYFHYLSKA